MKHTHEQLKNLLIQHHVQPSHYRIRILDCLSHHDFHPTADELFQLLRDDFPTLSKMTVYNTIDALLAATLIRKVSMGTSETRYDGTIGDHGHFKCDVCHTIYNIDCDFSTLVADGLNEFKIKHQDVYFYGTCAQCLKKVRNTQERITL